ncbi:MAG: PilZ domain-containing protein [Planctomycetota bacterium]
MNAPLDRAGTQADRRAAARRPVVLPAKILHLPSRKYAVAETIDVSNGGLMLRVEPSRPLAPGDAIKVAVAWQHSGVMRKDQMLEAKVVRVARVPGQAQAVAVEFAEEVALAQVA